MKKQLSLVGAMAFAFGLQAQSQISTELVSYNPYLKVDMDTWAPYQESASKVSNIAVTVGSGGNAYGIMFDNKNYININNDLGLLAMAHRSNPAVTQDASSGSLRYGYSTNGGTSFSQNQGPLWNPTGSTEFARYPQSAIFNPPNNTVADSAYIVFFAPTLKGTNDGWGGVVVGSSKINGGNLSTTEFVTGTTPGFSVIIPNDMTVNQSNNKVFGITEMRSATAYLDSLILTVGTWNATNRNFDWVNQKIHAPAGLDENLAPVFVDAKIAFAPNGQTGYIACLGYSGDTVTAPAPTIQIMMFKTTNGGTTWTGPTSVNMNTLPILNGSGTTGSFMSDYGTAAGWTVTDVSAAFNCDLVVDKDGNPHVITNMCPAGSTTITTGGAGTAFSIFSGINTMFDVYSSNGGTTYGAFFLDTVDFFRGSYGASADLSEDNRPQASRTDDGEYVLFTWGETDFDIWGTPTEGNIYPDVVARAIRMSATPQVFAIQNFGNQDINFKGGAHQHTLAEYLVNESADPTDPKLITPIVVQSFTNGNITADLDPVTYHYLPYEYSLSANISVNEFEEATNISSIFPNPANSGAAVHVVVNNNKADNLAVELSELTGRKIYAENLGFIGTG